MGIIQVVTIAVGHLLMMIVQVIVMKILILVNVVIFLKLMNVGFVMDPVACDKETNTVGQDLHSHAGGRAHMMCVHDRQVFVPYAVGMAVCLSGPIT